MSGAFPDPRTDQGPQSGLTGGAGVHSWLTKCGGHDDICLAFNEVASWDVQLAESLFTRLVTPMEAAGVELTRGVDWYCFVASTGTTPFGVHTDAEPSFIFHLGPAPKTVWTWSLSALSVLPHGRPRTLDARPLLAKADRVRLQTGDFLLIPAGMFHVFGNDGPSMFLGLTVYPDDPEKTAIDAVEVEVRREVRSANRARSPGTAMSREPFDVATTAVEALRQVLRLDRIQRTVERTAMWRRSCGYGHPPRFPGRTHDNGPPYVVTRLPMAVHKGSVFALGRELSVDLGDVAHLLRPGTVLDEGQLLAAADTPELQAAVAALVHVGALRSLKATP